MLITETAAEIEALAEERKKELAALPNFPPEEVEAKWTAYITLARQYRRLCQANRAAGNTEDTPEIKALGEKRAAAKKAYVDVAPILPPKRRPILRRGPNQPHVSHYVTEGWQSPPRDRYKEASEWTKPFYEPHIYTKRGKGTTYEMILDYLISDEGRASDLSVAKHEEERGGTFHDLSAELEEHTKLIQDSLRARINSTDPKQIAKNERWVPDHGFAKRQQMAKDGLISPMLNWHLSWPNYYDLHKEKLRDEAKAKAGAKVEELMAEVDKKGKAKAEKGKGKA